MKVNPQLGCLQQLKDVPIKKVLNLLWDNMAKAINGQIEFGSPTNGSVNIKGTWAGTPVVTPAPADTEFTITHNLGVVPTGYLVVSQNKAGSIYKGATPWTTTQIFLKCSGSSVTIVLFVI